MDLKTFVTKLEEEFSKVEVHSHSEVKTMQEYNRRYPVLVNLLNLANDRLSEVQYKNLLELRNRISHSIRTLDLAKRTGLIHD